MIRRFRWLHTFLLLGMVILFATGMLAAAGKGMYLQKTRAKQQSVINGVRSIDKASSVIIENIKETAYLSSADQFNKLCKVADDKTSVTLSESELEQYYRVGFYNSLLEEIGDTPNGICDTIDSYINGAGIKNVKTIRDGKATFTCNKDEDGNITEIHLENISIQYKGPIIGERVESSDYEIGIPEALFYTENEDLFNCAIAANKGIYATGRTSSIIGNIYAGEHTPEEVRPTEKAYGESGVYGGINLLSTQMGIEADTIVSKGDVNINGSFVIFSSEDNDLKFYGNNLNSIESYSRESMVKVDGEFNHINKLDGDELDYYKNYVSEIETSFSRLENIPLHYDSNNDENYEGKYRKIISNAQVEITEDFTGVIITPANVIVGNDVNFEGLILCGDRVYIRGNNNIFANRSIAVEIIRDENEQEGEYSIMHYIGGIKRRGVTPPKYWVVPVSR